MLPETAMIVFIDCTGMCAIAAGLVITGVSAGGAGPTGVMFEGPAIAAEAALESNRLDDSPDDSPCPLALVTA